VQQVQHCSSRSWVSAQNQGRCHSPNAKAVLIMTRLGASLLAVAIACSNGFSMDRAGFSRIESQLAATPDESSRRRFLNVASTTVASLAAAELVAEPCSARYILNEETGDYDEIEEKDWQATWGSRLEKAKSMGTDDVFLAAKGGLKQSESDGPEGEASKKRRALAGCRTDRFREKSGVKDTKQCTSKVLGGEYDFILEQMP